MAFGDLGYSAATFERIAAAAGVKLGSVYFHFKSKFSLAQAVVAEQHERAIKIMTNRDFTDCSATETLIIFSRQLAQLILSDPVVRGGILLTLEDSSLSTPALPFYDEGAQRAATIIQRGIDSGEFSASICPKIVADTLIGCFTGVQLLSNARCQRDDLFEHLEALWEIILSGLAPGRSHAEELKLLRNY